MRRGLKLAASRGVTAVHDKDGWLGALRLWQRLEARGLADAARVAVAPGRARRRAARARRPVGLRQRLLRVGYLKVFMDGTLGSQTAWMLDGSGVRITSGEELASIVRAGAARRAPGGGPRDRRSGQPRGPRRVRGDAREWEPLGLRQRIEHAQLLAPEDVGRFAALGVAASVQFSHAPSDRDLADRYWAGKTDGAYAYRSLLESGAVVANGSDAPIEELDPLAGIRAGVRRTVDERDAWHPEQAVTVQQAFEATTLAPAWLAGDERRRGKLLPGYAADLVVLDRDPWDDLDARVVATMVGRPVGAQPAAVGLIAPDGTRTLVTGVRAAARR